MELPPPPSRKQLASARALIVEQEAQIAATQAVSDEIRELIRRNSDYDTGLELAGDQTALETELVRLQKELTVLQCYIAPIRRLPVELIGEIVVLVVGVRNRDIVSVIETLSMVCKLWRSVIISTPRLWTYIPWSNQLSAHPGQFISNPTALALWLQRSGKLRVDLFLKLGGLDSSNRCSPVPDCFTSGTMFQRHGAQLRSFRIIFLTPGPDLIKRLMWALNGALVHVENMDVDIIDQDAAAVRKAEGMFALSAKQLRSLHTSCFAKFKGRWFTSVGSLRHLHVGTIRATLLVDFFVQHGDFPSLISLVSDDLDEHTQQYVGPPVVVKTKLLSLGLHARGRCDILLWLHFPRLEILQLRAKSSLADTKAIATFQALMKESAPPLGELYLTNFNFNGPDHPARLLECVREAPVLSRLCIQHRSGMPATLLDLLSKPSDEGWVCPELTEIFIGEQVSKKIRADVSAESQIQRCDVEMFVTLRLNASDNAASDQESRERADADSVKPVVLKPVRVRLGSDEYHPDASGRWDWTERLFSQPTWFSFPQDLATRALR